MYFDKCETLDELKREYRRLALENHPDMGGDERIMIAINLEYERRHEALQTSYNATRSPEYQKHETAAEYIDIISALMKIRGVSVELCGSWLWITGDTRASKDALKDAGCKWAPKKAMWYWHPGDYKRKTRKTMTMDHIRTKYGSTMLGRSDAELVAT